ncbi:hypothetical protein F503_05420 [Ophiostoma piceae UAMH 11346]|uniref:Uncharacterized protein n=1 Tax=Ophiostoma piceae (strain UAMH 11346) TaxID=1262450 RepID=S3D9Z0_OPHP1|nr:hypothetical protein F503_05420 [Ophiostoma piceae UAMH 11346]
MDHSFSEPEKRFILAEMLKASQVEITAVVDFIKSRHIYPNWMEMELPRGNMGIEAPPPALSQHHSQFRQYGSQPPAQQLSQQPLQQQVQPQQQHHRQQHMPQHRQHQQHPQESPPPLSKLPSLTAKRRPSTDSGDHPNKRLAAASADVMHPIPQPRTIQPRPTNGPVPNSPLFTAAAPPAARNVPKKRGRPSRADKDAQARAAGNYPLAYIAPASNMAIHIEGQQKPLYQPTSTRSTPEGHVSNADSWEHQGHMRRSTDRSPQPGREPYFAPGEVLPNSLKSEPARQRHPTPQEPPTEPAATLKPSPPLAANPQPSSRLAVADLLKSAGSAVITTGV